MTNRDQLEFNILQFIQNTLSYELFLDLRYYYELNDQDNLKFYDDLDYKEFINYNLFCIRHIDYSQLLMISLIIDNIDHFIVINNNNNFIEKNIKLCYFNHNKQFVITYI